MKRTIIYLFILAFFVGCQNDNVVPAPTVSFDYTIKNEGVVSFFPSSTNVKEYYWSFGNSEISHAESPTVKYGKNGTYTVTVKVKGEGGEATYSSPVSVTNVSGSVIFWMQGMKNKSIQVSLGGVVRGAITGYYANSVPDCGAQASVTVNGLPAGTYKFEAKELDAWFPSVWSGTVTIVGGSCTKKMLYYSN